MLMVNDGLCRGFFMKIEKTYDNMTMLKGMGAIIVCSAHILDCFVWKNGNKPLILETIFNKPFIGYLLWSGGVQVYIFCLISGYFSWHKHIENFKELCLAIFKRYINFVSMILFCNLFAYSIFLINGYPVYRASVLLCNESLPFRDVPNWWSLIRASFALKSQLNGALWMIKSMFYGNCVVYILKFISTYIGKTIYGLCLVAIWLMAFVDWISVIVICGIILYEIISRIPNTVHCAKHKVMLTAALLISIFLAQNRWGISGTKYYIHVTIVCGMICIIVQLLDIHCKLGDMLIKYSKKCSISIYCIHIPIIYSIGLYVFILTNQFEINKNIAIIITYILTMITVLGLANLYQVSIEKIRKNIIQRIIKILNV